MLNNLWSISMAVCSWNSVCFSCCHSSQIGVIESLGSMPGCWWLIPQDKQGETSCSICLRIFVKTLYLSRSILMCNTKCAKGDKRNFYLPHMPLGCTLTQDPTCSISSTVWALWHKYLNISLWKSSRKFLWCWHIL